MVVIKGVVVLGEVRHKKIEPAIVVVVPDRDPHVGLRSAIGTQGTAGFEGNLLKPAVPLISPEVVGHGVVRHEDIRPSVVVKIEPYHSQAIAFDAVVQADILTDFAKLPVAFIVIEQVRQPGQSARATSNGKASIVAIRVSSWSRHAA